MEVFSHGGCRPPIDSIPSDQVIGTYDCRQAIWRRSKKLKVGDKILTKCGARLAKLYYDECLVEPDFEGFLDAAANRGHYALSYTALRLMRERTFRDCEHSLDERARLWLADERSWESLAPCPIPWDKIVAMRRDGIHNVATLQMLDDKQLSKIDGIGPARIKLVRSFCGRAIKEQAKATPKPKRNRAPKKPAPLAEPALF